MADERVERGNKLAGALGAGHHFPLHALWRLLALIGDEDVVYAESAVDESDVRRIGGPVVVITENRVLLCTINANGADTTPSDASTVQCLCWARGDLSHVEFGTKSSDDNRDTTWAREAAEGWPRGARLTLTYGSADRQLTLPLEPGLAVACTNFAAALPTLLGDLRR